MRLNAARRATISGSLLEVMNPQAKNRVVTAAKARKVRRRSADPDSLRRRSALHRNVATDPEASGTVYRPAVEREHRAFALLAMEDQDAASVAD